MHATLFAGLAIITLSLLYRTNDAPRLSMRSAYHPRNWKPIWKVQSWYTPRGFKLHLLGWGLFFIGVGLRLLEGEL